MMAFGLCSPVSGQFITYINGPDKLCLNAQAEYTIASNVCGVYVWQIQLANGQTRSFGPGFTGQLVMNQPSSTIEILASSRGAVTIRWDTFGSFIITAGTIVPCANANPTFVVYVGQTSLAGMGGPPIIDMCNSSVRYSIDPPFNYASLDWSVNNQVVQSGTSYILNIDMNQYLSNSSQAVVSVTSNSLCSGDLPKTRSLTVQRQEYTIQTSSSTSTVDCRGGFIPFAINSIPNASYLWTFTSNLGILQQGSTGLDSNNPTFNFSAVSAASTGTITVTVTQCGVTKSASYTVSRVITNVIYNGGAPATGSLPVCKSPQNTTFDTYPGATSPSWSIPSGFSLVSGSTTSSSSIKLKATSVNSQGILYVTYNHPCNNQRLTASLNVTGYDCSNGQPRLASVSSKSTADLETPALRIYPNPVTNNLQIENLTPKTVHILKFYNNLGQLMKEISFENDSYSCDLRSLANGIYFLNIVEENAIKHQQKILISR